MKRGIKFEICILLMAMLLVSMASVQAADAKLIPLREPAPEPISVDSDLNLPKDDQKLVIEAIKASD